MRLPFEKEPCVGWLICVHYCNVVRDGPDLRLNRNHSASPVGAGQQINHLDSLESMGLTVRRWVRRGRYTLSCGAGATYTVGPCGARTTIPQRNRGSTVLRAQAEMRQGVCLKCAPYPRPSATYSTRCINDR